ncbi:Ankrd17 [Symbiodinium microadriaticum]|nr:Ankrd17 [Symbiodinium microadriaticum]
MPGGCRDLQLCIRIGGVTCELQLNVPGMIYVKESGRNRIERDLAAAVAHTGIEAVKRALNTLNSIKDHLGQDGHELKAILNSKEKPLLLKAAEAGNAELMSVFLQYGADIDIKVMEGGYERAMWLLLENGADWNVTDKDGIAPLMEGLLRLRSEPDNEYLGRAVCILSQVTKIDYVRAIRSQLKQAVKKRLKQSTELPAHCQDGDVRKVRELLNSYADADSRGADNERGLHKALSPVGGVRNFTPGHLQICELLLQFSADCKKEDNFGATPLALAARLGSTEVMSLLQQHGATVESVRAEDLEALVSEVGDEDAEAALEWLRDAGCDFTASTRNEGELPTFVAARRGNTRLLQVLEDAGCDMGWRNRSGDSAIVAAARAGQTGAARWFLEAGSIDAVDLQRARYAASKLDKPDEMLELIETKWRAERRGPLNLQNLSLLDRPGAPKGSDFEKIMLTAAAKQNSKNSGAFYFEVQLLSKIERINVGWATTAYQRSRDLGFDAESWCWQSQDGRTMFQLHAAEGPEAGSGIPRYSSVALPSWEPGDVLGLALDFAAGKMRLSHQGKWQAETEAGYFMDFQPNGRDLYPAVTAKWGLFRLRLGKETWIFGPPKDGPKEGYEPWASGVGEWANEATFGDRSWGFDMQLSGRRPRLLGLEALGYEVPKSISDFFAAGLPELSRASGKFYYELRLLSRPESPRVGWATEDFHGGAIGDDPESFAFEGWRMMKWNAGERPSLMTVLTPEGDLLGLAVDLDVGEMRLCSYRQVDISTDIAVGSLIRIKKVSVKEAKRVAEASGCGWASNMEECLGQEGQYVTKDSDGFQLQMRGDVMLVGDLAVCCDLWCLLQGSKKKRPDGQQWWFPPALLHLNLSPTDPTGTEDVDSGKIVFDPKGRKLSVERFDMITLLFQETTMKNGRQELSSGPRRPARHNSNVVLRVMQLKDWRAGRELQGRPSLLGLRGIRPVEIEEDASIGLWLTAGAKDAARSSGKFYHEVQLFTDTGCPQFGWLSTGFEEGPHDGNGVGDDEHGYAFDGDRLLNWKAGRKQKVEVERWKVGDILGFAIDLDAGVMFDAVSVLIMDGGCRVMMELMMVMGAAAEEGYVMKSDEMGGREWYPAVSGRVFYQMHIDKKTWRFAPPQPSEDYQAWASGIFEWRFARAFATGEARECVLCSAAQWRKTCTSAFGNPVFWGTLLNVVHALMCCRHGLRLSLRHVLLVAVCSGTAVPESQRSGWPGLAGRAGFQEALALSEAGRWQAAASAWRGVLEEPTSCPETLRPHAHCALGDALQKLGRDRQAAEEFTAATRLAPNFAAAALRRGTALRRLGDFRGAEAAYRSVLRRSSGARQATMAELSQAWLTSAGAKAKSYARSFVAHGLQDNFAQRRTCGVPATTVSQKALNPVPFAQYSGNLLLLALALWLGGTSGILEFQELRDKRHAARWLSSVCRRSAAGQPITNCGGASADAEAARRPLAETLRWRAEGGAEVQVSDDSDEAWLARAAFNRLADAPQWALVEDKCSLDRLLKDNLDSRVLSLIWPRTLSLPGDSLAVSSGAPLGNGNRLALGGRGQADGPCKALDHKFEGWLERKQASTSQASLTSEPQK